MPNPHQRLPSAKAINAFGLSAPKELIDLYHKHLHEHLDSGKTMDESHRRALRMTQHAGWYKGIKGWKQIHPDLREKVNVREATRQPDGRYMVEGVDVFYPNAVKGKHMPFSASDIRHAISNTNRSIAAGAQKPSMLEGHPTQEQSALGTQLDSHGAAVNWREHPKRPGWAVCDLIDLDVPTVERLRDRKLTGLSAGFAKDANGLNRRFGHVAMLGGTSQALSQLPTTEIYSTASNHYVCFSADAEFSFKKGSPMKMSEKQSSCFAALRSAHEAHEAARKSQELNEPDALSKLGEAGTKLGEAYSAFDAEMQDEQSPQDEGAGQPSNEMPGTDPMPGEDEGQNAPAPQGPAGENVPDFEADPAGAFAALQDQVKTLNVRNANTEKLAKALRTQNMAMSGRMEKSHFDAEVAKLKSSGVKLPSNVDEQFSACMDHKEPRKAIAVLLKGFQSLPKNQTPGTSAPMFAADGNQPVTGKPKPSKTAAAAVQKVQESLPSMNFSDDDLKFAALGESLSGDSK